MCTSSYSQGKESRPSWNKLTSIALILTLGWSSTQASKDEQIWNPESGELTIDRQLIRHKVITSPCDILALLSGQTSYRNANRLFEQLNKFISAEEIQSSRYPASANQSLKDQLIHQLENSSKIQCEEDESISLVSLEDLTKIGLQALNETKAQSSLVPEELCKLRLQVVRIRKEATPATVIPPQIVATDNNIEAGEIWQPDAFGADDHQLLESCNNIIEYELSLLNRTRVTCNFKHDCTIAKLSAQSYLDKSCIQLNQYDLTPLIKLVYVCLPEDSRFSIRTIKFEDLINTVSCSRGELLYVKKVSFTTNPNLTAKSNCDHGSSSCIKSIASTSPSPRESLLQENDLLDIGEEFDGEAIDDYPSDVAKRSPAFYGDVGSDEGGPSRQSRSFQDCDMRELIPNYIIGSCHANASCSISLRQIIRKFARNRSMCLLKPGDFRNSAASLEYACLRAHKFSDFLSSNTRSLIRKDVQKSGLVTIYNQFDYGVEPSFVTELGKMSLSQMGQQIRSNSRSSTYVSKQFVLLRWQLALTIWITLKLIQANYWGRTPLQ